MGVLQCNVALRKESVDRNFCLFVLDNRNIRVALRKESVDRNFQRFTVVFEIPMSLSARRAWIEITKCRAKLYRGRCRSPQGERG